MPLRSVEAATRDDAIAAAREQFGPQARIVGVRRVRSGGVLGFFATERYVAEVAPDVSRPPAPTGARSSSPLASAAPATAAPSASPRAAAPARNGAAVYAAEAGGRTPSPRSDEAPRSTRSEVIARAVAARSVADDDRVSELAGLLEEAERSGLSPVLVCSPQVRAALARLMRQVLPRLPVISYAEVSRTAQIESLGVVSGAVAIR